MKRAWFGLVLGVGGWACGEAGAGSGNNAPSSSEGGAEQVGAAGEPAAGTGGSAQAGSKTGGGASSGSAGATTMSGGKAGSLGGADAGEAGGGGEGIQGLAGSGNEPCNDLELIEMAPTCTTLGTPIPEQGGTLVGGRYALVAYQMPSCLAGLEQTLRIEQTGPTTYHVETFANLGETRANSTFVQQSGVEFSSTSSCGADEIDEPYGYTVFEDEGVPHLRLANRGTFTYRRVSD